MRLLLILKQWNSNNFQIKVPGPITRCDVHHPQPVLGQLFTTIVLSQEPFSSKLLNLDCETCILKDDKGLGPVVKILHTFYYAREEEKGDTWKKIL